MELLPARDSMNKGPVHILVQVSGGHTPFLLGDYLEVEWPDRMGVERLTCTERGRGRGCWHKETFQGDGSVQYLETGDGFVGIKIRQDV